MEETLKRLIEAEGYAGAAIALAEVIEEMAVAEADASVSTAMIDFAEKLRELAE